MSLASQPKVCALYRILEGFDVLCEHHRIELQELLDDHPPEIVAKKVIGTQKEAARQVNVHVLESAPEGSTFAIRHHDEPFNLQLRILLSLHP